MGSPGAELASNESAAELVPALWNNPALPPIQISSGPLPQIANSGSVIDTWIDQTLPSQRRTFPSALTAQTIPCPSPQTPRNVCLAGSGT
ncbi:hypothetical protein [Labilithrix luteola]|uniref:hypothetical protein n=1 Tax=Labilithrix luteola TaxID=1391654 RepID=UPI0011BAD169|nr:hypothetical protein [Labilithrix luteola]